MLNPPAFSRYILNSTLMFSSLSGRREKGYRLFISRYRRLGNKRIGFTIRILHVVR